MEEEEKDLQSEPVTPAETPVAESALPPKKINRFDKFFGITASGSTFKTEIIAGLTTFLAMVYILMVNADMFSLADGVSYGAAYIATAVGAVAGTLLMALLARMPLAQASGMGINAFIVYTLLNVFVESGSGLTYANCMVFTLIDGLIFVILTATGLREKIFKAIPEAVRHAIPVGIGLFIAFIGLQQAQVIVGGATLVEFASFNVLNSANTFAAYDAVNNAVIGMLPALIAILGVLAIAVLSKKKVKGAILWGILGSAVLYYVLLGIGYACGSTGCADIFQTITFKNPFTAFADWGTQSVGKVFYEGFNFSGYLETAGAGGLALLIITTALSLCMIDMFDTLGTLYGACAKGNLLDAEGKPINMGKMMLCDAIGTCVGAVAGTSTVTTFVESSSGVAAGGKTGFTALITAACFFIAMFLSPIAQLIPRCATASALIWVGVLMMSSVTKIDWEDFAEAIVAFLAMIVMVLGYSISKGIGVGIIAFVLVKLCTGKVKEISVVTWVIAALFLVTFLLT